MAGGLVEMSYKTRKKNLLFIEPYMSSQSFIYDAQMNGYGTFVLSNNDAYLSLPKKNFMVASTFFQVDTLNEQSVLNLIKQINQKFEINGVIPEYNYYNLLSAKIAHYLKKPGLTPQAACKIQEYNFLPNNLEIKGITKECGNEEEYRVDGLVSKKNVYIFSVTERFLLDELENREGGYIIRSEIDSLFLGKIIDCLQRVASISKLGHGFFHAKIKWTEGEVTLLRFKMEFAQKYMPKLVSHATGISYNHTVYKLFSSQPLSLHQVKKLNVGIIFFYKKFMRAKQIMQYLENLAQNACVIEIKEYDKGNALDQRLSLEHKGHVILIHEDYGILKDHIEKILIQSGAGH